MDPRAVSQGFTRETSIRRDARGRWFNGDDRIDHPTLAEAFDGWIDRASDGRYCLSNEVNWAYIEVEGPPYFVRQVRSREGGGLDLVLSGGRVERLAPETLRQGPDGELFCDVRDGRLAARFDRHALQQLAELAAAEDDDGPYLVLAGRRWDPPTVQQPLSPMAERH
jgi:hypothetical protein